MFLIIITFQVQNNLCTPKNGEILVASTQDFLTSSFLVTRKDNFYDRSSFSLLCSYLGDSMENIDLPTPALIKVKLLYQSFFCMAIFLIQSPLKLKTNCSKLHVKSACTILKHHFLLISVLRICDII
jgi:DNA-directed RNA polymerase beta' subunit